MVIGLGTQNLFYCQMLSDSTRAQGLRNVSLQASEDCAVRGARVKEDERADQNNSSFASPAQIVHLGTIQRNLCLSEVSLQTKEGSYVERLPLLRLNSCKAQI